MSATPENCFHLTVDIVREIHAEAIAKFGGSDGVREMALLEAAVGAPQASFGGKSPTRIWPRWRRRICFICAGIIRSLTATNGWHWARALSSCG